MNKVKHPDFYSLNPKNIFLVGGAVRDLLMGLNPKDKDYLVINTTEEEMLSLGFSQVGSDFPVFLHPKSGEEFALARKERKTASGYSGFTVETKGVTLEEDLMRRDLTINAIAMNLKDKIIDPFGGKVDINSRLLKHVGVHFKEDPLRILRTARFAARYNFSIYKDTVGFMQEMVNNGEFDNLTKERVWKEFEKVVNEPYLEAFFSSLKEIRAINKLGEFNTIYDKPKILKTISSHENEDIKLSSIFIDFTQKELNEFKIPVNTQKNIMFYNKWLNHDFYNSLMPIEKLDFIKDSKGIHEPSLALKKLADLIDYKTVFSNMEISQDYKLLNLEVFKQDVEKMQTLDYSSIIKDAPKSSIGKIVRGEQIKLISHMANKPKF